MEPQISTEPVVTLDEIKANFQNRKWRINHLYYIKDENGNKVLFQMNAVQEYIHDNLWFFNIIPKARQLGVTTFFAVLYLDQILFSENKTAGIIAHKMEDMKKIFRNKIKFAWDNLHPWMKAKIGEPDGDSAYELSWKDRGSSIFVSTSTRSGTVQYLHISEFGYICQKFPDRAEEIVTGAINSVHAGNMVSIESTAAGHEGYFYDFCMEAEKMRKEARELTELDFKLFFFPWWIDERYTIDSVHFVIPKELQDYFKLLKDKHAIELTDGQQRWYTKKKQLNRDKMFAEYPSTLDEAFMANQEGSYYGAEMNRVYLTKRITILPVDPKYPVDTYWDIGMSDDTIVLFVQSIGPVIRFVDSYKNRGEGLKHYVGVLKERGYRYGRHYFPHDIEVRDMSTGVSRKTTLYDLGLFDIVVAAKVGIQDGIDAVRTLFARFYFDEEKCADVAAALQNYRKDFDQKLGVFKDSPRHDSNSHIADAVRVLGVTWSETIETDPDLPVQKEKDQSFFSSPTG